MKVYLNGPEPLYITWSWFEENGGPEKNYTFVTDPISAQGLEEELVSLRRTNAGAVSEAKACAQERAATAELVRRVERENAELRTKHARPAAERDVHEFSLPEGRSALIRWMSGNYACAVLLVNEESVEKFLSVKSLWQPIETAPKDGTHILVSRVADPASTYREIHVMCWKYDTWLSTWDFGDRAHNMPTHWTPLPEPPK